MIIDLENLIQNLKINRKELAQILFPKSAHPIQGLNRLISRRTMLDEQQLYRLSTYTGLSIDAMYDPAMFWKATVNGEHIRFTNGDYTALYDPETGITKITLFNSRIAIHVISARTQTLKDFLSEINQIIINKKIQEP